MIGREILNYKIIKLLGAGGMGTVYLAVNKYIGQQKVAIKVIHPDIANDYTREKLHQEAEHLASLDHPNIVKFMNYHIDDDGTIYLIMEYADGVSLERFINEVNGLVVEDRVCGLFEPILNAFGYAHGKGILHRDIKPSNIIITPEGTPKILDFGIAKIIGDESETDKVIVGTPSYMSPEQVRGEKLDNRSDIYSLGVLLHQMMTGNAPYDTTTLTEHEINQKVVNEPLPRLRSFYKYVGEKTQKVIDKATAKNAEDRYRDCEDFRKDLHKAIYPPKIPRWVYGSVAALILLVCGAGFWFWDYNRTKVNYYKDYTEVWGEPVGIGKLSSNEYKHSRRAYRIESSRGKVRRLTHVNSYGKPIEDGESERVERPTDALYYYTPEGQVSRVKVMDHNGHVQYVKVYNDNLKTAVFQYDDEHGTEKVLGSKTIGYVQAFGNNLNDNKGKITRYHLTYDDKGHVTRIDYAGLFNARVHDADNIYGRAYVRDSKGRVTEESYLNAQGEPQATKWGLGIKTFEYDDNDNWVRSTYLTPDRKPSLDASDGTAVYELVYDTYGNVTEATHHADDGSLMLPERSKIAGIKYEYDDHGNILKTMVIGIDGGLSYTPDGESILEDSYDGNGFVVDRRILDADGNRTSVRQNYSRIKVVNDERGNPLEVRYYDINDEPVLFEDNYAWYACTYDSLGNQTSLFHYGLDDKLICIEEASGVAGYTISYDKFGNPVKIVNYNADSVPAPTYNNVTVLVREYDTRGNVTRISVFADEECSQRQNDDEGVAIREYVYDDNGNEIESVNFDKDGIRTFGAEHWAIRKTEYDEAGNPVAVRWYAPDGTPTYNSSRKAGILRTFDHHGNITQETSIGTDGKPLSTFLICRYTYDDADNQLSEAVFNIDGTPASGGLGYHRAESDYDSNKREIERRYYDTKGNLTGYNGSKVAVIQYEYDNRGNITETSYFNNERKPVDNNDHYASQRSEFDNLGRITRQRYFDVNGKPTDPNVMVPEGITGYDKYGNINYVASLDGNGNYIYNPMLGAAIKRMTFDLKGNQTEQSYYDENDKPVVSKTDGYHRSTASYDRRGNIVEQAYFDASGQPMVCAMTGYHRIARTYDDLNRFTSETLYGADGKQCTFPGTQYSKAEYIYDDASGTAKRARLYSPGGQLVASLYYNGNQWLPEGNSGTTTGTPQKSGSTGQDWRAVVRELQSNLPYNMGSEAGNLECTSINITGSNSVEMVFTAEESKYEMNKTLQSGYEAIITAMGQELKNQLPGIKVTVKLLDRPGREVCTKKI